MVHDLVAVISRATPGESGIPALVGADSEYAPVGVHPRRRPRSPRVEEPSMPTSPATGHALAFGACDPSRRHRLVPTEVIRVSRPPGLRNSTYRRLVDEYKCSATS